MDMQHLNDLELLQVLLGRETAQKISYRSLYEILGGGSRECAAHPKLLAARELVMRSLCEEMAGRDALSTPNAVRDYLKLYFRDKDHEVFVAVFLDAQNRVIAVDALFQGTLTQTSVYPREVVRHSLRRNAAAVIFAHNHPSGVAEPSHADEALTGSLRQALALVDVRVLDHFVVAGNVTTSFAERGVL